MDVSPQNGVEQSIIITNILETRLVQHGTSIVEDTAKGGNLFFQSEISSYCTISPTWLEILKPLLFVYKWKVPAVKLSYASKHPSRNPQYDRLTYMWLMFDVYNIIYIYLIYIYILYIYVYIQICDYVYIYNVIIYTIDM